MDKIELSLASGHGLWFGVLVDGNDRLVASALYSAQNSLRKYLDEYARKITGSNPEEVEHELAGEMVTLFEGRARPQRFNLNPERVSPFQNRVHQILLKIPKRRVTTYGRIATYLGTGPRAVGTAVSSNPLPLFVPCHRVVPAGLNVGNYSMNGTPSRESSKVKAELLRREGVRFEGDRISPSSTWIPQEA